ncbi:4-phosphoerythronate dehydrogenase PdxB [soil metagenome]
MRLLIDANIPLAAEAFAEFGECLRAPGREITRESLQGVDALIVRSITQFNAALLEGTPVKFVGTATIGTDHLDIPWLEANSIAWSSAAGCNSRSVVEWVVAGLVENCVARGISWEGKTLGIVGHGNIGSRLSVVARNLGMDVIVCDPPLQRADTSLPFVPLEGILKESDFVTLHVPLIKTGIDKTVGMIGEKELAMMKPGAVLFNAARGAAVSGAAVLTAKNVEFILDVFENEPTPDPAVINRCCLATPHVAGYSHEGKVMGTFMIASALARFVGKELAWKPVLAPPAEPDIDVAGFASSKDALLKAIRHSYPIRRDDAGLRAGVALPVGERAKRFDEMRKNYFERREFANYEIQNAQKKTLQAWLLALNFKLPSP